MYTLRAPLAAPVRALLDAEALERAQAPVPLDDAALVRAVRSMLDGLAARRGGIPGLPNGVRAIDARAGAVPVRIYEPERPSGAPTLVYFHGGGWVAGGIETHDPFCRLLAHAAHVTIVSVGYRLAPEYPYPAALEDALSALHWAANRARERNGGFGCIALGGDSAGGNLAAVAANVVCGKLPIRALMLLYPVTDHPSANHASYRENAEAFGLDAAAMRWFWSQYAGDASPDDPRLSPLRIPIVPHLPPTLIATAEYDVLRDEGIAYAQRLAAAGTDVAHIHAADMPHNFAVFPDMVARFPQSDDTLAAISRWLRAALNHTEKENEPS